MAFAFKLPKPGEEMPNPIAFNPDTMTLTQAKACCETLRTLYELLDRKADDADIALYVEQSRDFMVKNWGERR